MSPGPFDRSRLRFRSVAERTSRLRIDEIAYDPDGPAPAAGGASSAIGRAAEKVLAARRRGAPVILCHGAHLIKNGLGPLLIRLLEEGWITHVATNGAGSIHDWEFAFIGRSTEDVRAYVAVGEFGIWEETGANIGLALHLGAVDGLGYGASVGRMIAEERLRIPSSKDLVEKVILERFGRAGERASGGEGLSAQPAGEPVPTPGDDAWLRDSAVACLDLAAALKAARLGPGDLAIPHPWKSKSVQCAAWRLGVPLTVHPGIGQDIVYAHPLFRGAAVGRTAMTDFLVFVSAIERLDGGVYLSVGSSVMSPMIFEKALSMARNVLRQQGRFLEDFDIVVNDLAELRWDWARGEPPPSDPAYYVRFCKSFSRMGGRFHYVGADNRAFLGGLYARLKDQAR